jgi:multisubunit Na+/H+ antiporter MnhB subunit
MASGMPLTRTEDRSRGLWIAAGVLGFGCGLVAFVWFALIFLAFGVLALRHWRRDAVRLVVVFSCGFMFGFATLMVLSTPVNDGEVSGGIIEAVEDPRP